MSPNKKRLILEGIRRSEDRLKAQQALAISADLRAVTFAGILFAASTVLAGIANQSENGGPLFVTVFFLLLAAGLSSWTAMPSKFGVVGGRFDDLEPDFDEDTPRIEVLLEIGKHNDEHIELNDLIMAGNGQMMQFAFFSAIISPLPLIFFKVTGIW